MTPWICFSRNHRACKHFPARAGTLVDKVNAEKDRILYVRLSYWHGNKQKTTTKNQAGETDVELWWCFRLSRSARRRHVRPAKTADNSNQ